MIGLEDYKKALGDDLLKELSEEQILELREQQDKLADILFDCWLAEINKNKI